MPIIKSAIKKMRQDRSRTQSNRATEAAYLTMLRKAKKGTEKNVTKVHSAIDKAAKKGVIQANKAARLKSQVAKLLKPKSKSAK